MPNRVENALRNLRDAKENEESGIAALGRAVQERCQIEQEQVVLRRQVVEEAIACLKEAIQLEGPLLASAKSPYGWASLVERTERWYAPVSDWCRALSDANLDRYIPQIILEAVNGPAVQKFSQQDAAFHAVAEKLTTVTKSPPVLRYSFREDESSSGQ